MPSPDRAPLARANLRPTLPGAGASFRPMRVRTTTTTRSQAKASGRSRSRHRHCRRRQRSRSPRVLLARAPRMQPMARVPPRAPTTRTALRTACRQVVSRRPTRTALTRESELLLPMATPSPRPKPALRRQAHEASRSVVGVTGGSIVPPLVIGFGTLVVFAARTWHVRSCPPA